jgi:hypothetical protein
MSTPTNAGLEILYQNCIASLRYKIEIASHLPNIASQFNFHTMCTCAVVLHVCRFTRATLEVSHLTTVYRNFCRGISTDAESRTPMVRFLHGESHQSVASPAMGHWGTCPHKLEKAKKLSDDIIMQTNETMLNRCYI